MSKQCVLRGSTMDLSHQSRLGLTFLKHDYKAVRNCKVRRGCPVLSSTKKYQSYHYNCLLLLLFFLQLSVGPMMCHFDFGDPHGPSIKIHL